MNNIGDYRKMSDTNHDDDYDDFEDEDDSFYDEHESMTDEDAYLDSSWEDKYDIDHLDYE